SLQGVAQLVQIFIEQNNRKCRVDSLQLRAQGHLRKVALQLRRVRAVEKTSEAELAFLADRADERFIFRVKKEGATFRGVRGGALRGINGDLRRNNSARKKRRGQLGKS